MLLSKKHNNRRKWNLYNPKGTVIIEFKASLCKGTNSESIRNNSNSTWREVGWFIRHDLNKKSLMTMRKNESKKNSVINYKGLEERLSLLGFFSKKVVREYVFETTIKYSKICTRRWQVYFSWYQSRADIAFLKDSRRKKILLYRAFRIWERV